MNNNINNDGGTKGLTPKPPPKPKSNNELNQIVFKGGRITSPPPRPLIGKKKN